MPVTATTQLPDAQQPTLGNGVEDEIAVDIPDVTDYGDYRVQTRETGETAWDGTAVGFDEQVLSSDADTSGTVSTTVTGREDGEEYEVRMRTETEHVTGTWTTAVSITTKFPGATGISLTVQGQAQVDLSWTDNADNEDGFRVLRARDYGQDGSFGSFSQVNGDLAPNTTSFSDTTVSPGNTYRYKVRAFTEHTTADSGTADATTGSVSEPRDKEIPADGYYLEIDHPDGGTIRPSVVDNNAKYLPTLLGKPECVVPVPYDEAWFSDRWREQPMRLWKDGRQLEIDELEAVDTGPGVTVLRGVGATELDARVTDYVQEKDAHQEAEDLITGNTTYSANVDDPQASITGDVLIQEADTTAEWNDRFSTTVGNKVSSDLWHIENGRLKTRQTGYFSECEDGGVSAAGWTDVFDFGVDVSNDGVITAGANEGDISFTFTTDHAIPRNSIDGRWRVRFFDTNQPEFEAYFDGVKVEDALRNAFIAGESDFSWVTLTSTNLTSLPDPIPAGSHTLSVKFPSGVGGNDDNIQVDCMAVVDTRGGASFSETTNANDALPGPEKYPSSVGRIESDDAVSAEQVVAALLEVTANDTSNNFEIAASNDQGANWLTSSTDTLDQSFASGSGQVRVGFTLSNYTDDATTTPHNGDAGQEVDLYTLRVDLDDTPLLINKLFDNSLEDVLNRIARVSGQIWEARRLYDGTTQIEWTTPGQRTADESPAITDFEVSKVNMRPYDLVVVRGASKNRAGEAFQSDYDTAVGLDKQNVLEGSESVYDTSSDTVYELDTDYEIDYESGEITVLSGGNMSDSTKYNIDYRWETRGEHPTSGVPADPRTKVVNVSEATGARECGQLALSIYKGIQSPRYEGKITVDRIEAGRSLVDDITFEGLPKDKAYRIQRFEHTPESVVGWLETRRPTDQVVKSVKRRVDAIAGKT